MAPLCFFLQWSSSCVARPDVGSLHFAMLILASRSDREHTCGLIVGDYYSSFVVTSGVRENMGEGKNRTTPQVSWGLTSSRRIRSTRAAERGSCATALSRSTECHFRYTLTPHELYTPVCLFNPRITTKTWLVLMAGNITRRIHIALCTFIRWGAMPETCQTETDIPSTGSSALCRAAPLLHPCNWKSRPSPLTPITLFRGIPFQAIRRKSRL